MIIYDPRYHTFESWSSLMCEAYADQQLISGAREEDWVKWAERFVGVASISKEGVSAPSMYANWQDWAASLVNLTE